MQVPLRLLWITAFFFSVVLTAQPAPDAPAEMPPEPPAAVASPQTQAQDSANVQAVQAALESARKTNEDFAARLTQMERALMEQRVRDQQFLRDITRFALVVAALLASLALVAIVYIAIMQNRFAKQQQAALSSQIQALTSLPQMLLPLLSQSTHPTIEGARHRLQSSIENLENKLSSVENLAKKETHLEAWPESKSEQAPEKSDELLLRGQSLLNADRSAEALACFEQAMLLQPRSALTRLKKGVALERLRRLPDALQCYDAAIALDPHLAVAYLSKAGLLNRMQRYDEAMRCYEQALALTPKTSAV